ncbi:MAG: hypothetical protein NTW86_12480 [Candidatus Sumerlaeota bacterium]|nr:hypothetical protein [Candidatus Sumerlaeota bacterium]
MSDFFFELRGRLDQMPVISVHEHHRDEAFQRSLDLETILRNSYAGWLRIPRDDSAEGRRRYLEQVHANTFFFWLERALRDIYGLAQPLSESNWDSLSERIRERHTNEPDLHWTILRERCRYQAAILDADWQPGSNHGRPDFYRPAYRINMFVMSYHPEVNDHNGNNPWEKCGADFRHVDEVVDWLDAKIGGLRAEGAVAVKSALAYDPGENRRLIADGVRADHSPPSENAVRAAARGVPLDARGRRLGAVVRQCPARHDVGAADLDSCGHRRAERVPRRHALVRVDRLGRGRVDRGGELRRSAGVEARGGERPGASGRLRADGAGTRVRAGGESDARERAGYLRHLIGPQRTQRTQRKPSVCALCVLCG